MDLEAYRNLYAFTEWANGVVLHKASELSADDYTRDFGHAWGSVHGTLAHIYGGDYVWFRRWQGTSPPSVPDAEDFATLADLRATWESLMAERRAFVDGLSEADLPRIVEYTTTEGNPYAEPLWQLLLHVVNHSTDHRSQVATLLTQFGHPPPPLDMIAYFRL